jgi:hypothetical protein
MITLTPQQKLELMRQYDANPSVAILTVIQILSDQVENTLEAEKEKIRKELEQKYLNIEKIIQDLRGEDGEDSDPVEVAEIITSDPSFYSLTKGAKGDSIIGPPGNDYILTETDKKDIASKIEVPVVEKIVEHTETIVKEQPIVTEVIKEKAVTDEPLEIAEKLNTLTEKVEMTVIKAVDDPIQLAKIELLSVGNGGFIELIQPLSPLAFTWNFLQKNGEGLHHICYEGYSSDEIDNIILKGKMLKLRGPIRAVLFERDVIFAMTRSRTIIEFIL